jgi:predicted Rossmann fold nucleotide-binding protein DprA/Smf involved in DNA uptake
MGVMQRVDGASCSQLYGIGDRAILRSRCLGLICSVQCPGSVVIKTFDAVRELRDAGIVVAGGFHSPMERECLDFLLRGEQPVIVCAAKGLDHVPLAASWRAPIVAGRSLVLSMFGGDVTRTTVATAQARNEFVAALAAGLLVPYASPGGKAEATARGVVERGQPLFTFDDDENKALLQLGARPYMIDDVRNLLGGGE